MHQRLGFVTFAAAVLLLTLLAPSVSNPGSLSADPPDRSVAWESRPAGNTSINDAIALTGSSPTGTLPVGTLVRVNLRFMASSTTSAPNATVYVPQQQAVFPAVPASVQIFPTGVNLSVPFGSEVIVNSGTFTLRNATTFNTTGKVTFTSELAALMGSEPFGDLTVDAQWGWNVTTPTGTVTTSGWEPSPGQVIQPAEVAFLQSLQPRSFTVPATITACLTGPVQGRTFSLHAETPKPVDDFVINTTRDPVGGPLVFCLSIVIGATIAPQPLLAHVWDYESVTLLLYIVKLTVTNLTSGGGGGGGPDWTEYVDIAAILGVALVAVGVVVVLRRQPPHPPAPAQDVSPPP
ncbi:MAG: hypothetical protein L3K00_00750 [Thermoplasmata archaeon]|nr:hypothetical protein [Thermoplasmata archaeon]